MKVFIFLYTLLVLEAPVSNTAEPNIQFLPLNDVAGMDYIKDTSIEIRCHGLRIHSPENAARVLIKSVRKYGLYNNTANVEKVTFLECALPDQSYATAITELEINITTLKTLELKGLPELLFLASQFKDLNLTTLILTNYPKNFYAVSDFLRTMPNLKELQIQQAKIQPLWINNTVEKIKMVLVTTDRQFGGCQELKELEMVSMETAKFDRGFLGQCKKLTSLKVNHDESLTPKTLEDLLLNARSLQTLMIKDSKLDQFRSAPWLIDLVDLRRLLLPLNRIMSLTLPDLPLLEELDLQGNDFRQYNNEVSVVRLTGQLANLRILNLKNNPFFEVCDYNNIKGLEFLASAPSEDGTITLKSLEYLTLSETSTRDLCFGYMHLDSLKHLDLRNNKISSLQITKLPRGKNYFVNLKGNPIHNITINKADYDLLRRQNISFSRFSDYPQLDCDCNNAYLARAVREKLISVQNARCIDGTVLETAGQEYMEHLECSKETCVDVCTCRRFWKDNSTDVVCQALEMMPNIPNMRTLRASYNRIDRINPEDITDSLLHLDLTGNHVAHITQAAAEALFHNPLRTMRLAHNPLNCDCRNKPLFDMLKKYSKQVLDYEQLTCNHNGHLIHKLEPADLCIEATDDKQVALTAGLATTGAVIGLAALAAAFYYRFERQLKVYLYSRGWCLRFIREAELDDDRPFDAFLSFSHGDEEFIEEYLRPELEKTYKICIHYRDWLVGDFIPAQINRSVEQSKRTIIILSPHYLESNWALLEFRTAQTEAIKDRRPRVIVIILDDVLNNERMDREIRSYLKTNTYVKWGDPWFWRKLRYAMPHSRNNDLALVEDKALEINNV